MTGWSRLTVLWHPCAGPGHSTGQGRAPSTAPEPKWPGRLVAYRSRGRTRGPLVEPARPAGRDRHRPYRARPLAWLHVALPPFEADAVTWLGLALRTHAARPLALRPCLRSGTDGGFVDTFFDRHALAAPPRRIITAFWRQPPPGPARHRALARADPVPALGREPVSGAARAADLRAVRGAGLWRRLLGRAAETGTVSPQDAPVSSKRDPEPGPAPAPDPPPPPRPEPLTRLSPAPPGLRPISSFRVTTMRRGWCGFWTACGGWIALPGSSSSMTDRTAP